MDDYYTPIITPEERAARRKQREEVRKKKKRAQQRKLFRQIFPVFAGLTVLIVIVTFLGGESTVGKSHLTLEKPVFADMPFMPDAPEDAPEEVYRVTATENTVELGDELPSKYAVVIDLQNGTILAQKSADTVISPASMTKILTVLVASEYVADRLDETFTMTLDISDYCYVNGCSVVGLNVGETVTVRELLYGTILPSGADAAVCLANFVAGSHEAFVALMNQKVEELGLSDTAHFTNCVGLYDPENVCTVTDMALILKAAMDNELCREVLNAHTYQTAPTEQHPQGQVLSNLFLRRIEDHLPDGFEVIGAKTGFVNQSGNCAASCGRDSEGNLYICVTGNAYSSWRAIYDHVDLYSKYCL